MLVLDGRYAVENGAATATQPAYDLLLDRPVALVRLIGLPPSWQGERAARRLRLAWCTTTAHGPVHVGVEHDGLYVVLPGTEATALSTQQVMPSPATVDGEEVPAGASDVARMPLCRTALAVALVVVTTLTAALSVDGLLG